ncbi:MAG TPA: hypothetical protein PKD09_19465 [Aggregatilinea sp.]|jgi:hypothetical protein|uniref:hypothetical protein n=1 Tax=Aggregatilinea sp. TaxID=2806333 RepID=UPI002CD3E44F|nr:hypothetical protein [Aggregatilinea sp.]HML23844.1 hypothetical protein [Aggregatilinea sp.]
MIEESQQPVIGSVLRASTMGFVCGTRSQSIEYPSFGAFVRTYHGADADIEVIGLIYAISIDDDPLVRQLILANNMNNAAMRDQRENRLVPVEISVVNVGFIERGSIYHNLPPRPPLSLDPVQLCDNDCILRFTEQLDWLRLVLNTSDAPSDDLLGAALQYAAGARDNEDARYAFRVGAGRRLAGLLSYDLPRLQHLLRLIAPPAARV